MFPSLQAVVIFVCCCLLCWLLSSLFAVVFFACCCLLCWLLSSLFAVVFFASCCHPYRLFFATSIRILKINYKKYHWVMCIFEMLVVHEHRIIFVFPLIKEIHVMLVTSYNTHLPLMRGRRRKGGGRGGGWAGRERGRGGTNTFVESWLSSALIIHQRAATLQFTDLLLL